MMKQDEVDLLGMNMVEEMVLRKAHQWVGWKGKNLVEKQELSQGFEMVVLLGVTKVVYLDSSLVDEMVEKTVYERVERKVS